MRDIDNKKRFILPCAVLLAAALWGCGRDTQSYLAADTQAYADSGAQGESGGKEAPSDPGVLLVYICGEVVSPGVYELPAGSRICDAVEAASGLTADAAGEYWNLAEPLTDGQMICFPAEEEAAKGQEPRGASASGITADGKVNINTATLEELMTIPGVGQTRGEAILAYRQEHGAFQEPQDIMKVSGIGSTLYERMSGNITIE